ncbi:hypothetical protein Tsubulata_040295 [Turnera subulata]|uniref:DUF4283 domain-containing protein n=1 Tax=Turnera subulata TaxID=218843 RepID=A0A9Q0GLR3_9ROSI|nr:hypothetical protein Tsubulata_040295 [Turnera subulata]
MGSGKVILTFDSANDKKHYIDPSQDLLSNFFDSIEPWSPNMVSYERLSWLTCYGIPLHVWDKEFFKNFGSRFGKFLGVDASTAEKVSFECAKILICTDRHEPAKHVQRISVDDKYFDIVIFEEIIYELGQIVNSQNIVFWGFDSDCTDDSSFAPLENHLQPPDVQSTPPTINVPLNIIESTYLDVINSQPSQDIPS